MSLAEKCCMCFEIDAGCVAFGIGSFIISALMGVTSGVLLVLNEEVTRSWEGALNTTHHIRSIIGVGNPLTTDAILAVALAACLVTMVFSLMLIIGIRKNKPGLVLSFFIYGTLFSILSTIGGLLFLLKMYWITSTGLFVGSVMYIYFLTIVHYTYELMQRGKVFGTNGHDTLEEDLTIDTDAA